MKRFFLFAVISASLFGCATAPSNAPVDSTVSQDANGIPVEQPYRTPRTSIGVGIGSFGGHGFGGLGIGLGF
jgi:hypothetical protein